MMQRRALTFCLLLFPLALRADLVIDAINKGNRPFIDMFAHLCRAQALTISPQQKERYRERAQEVLNDCAKEYAQQPSKMSRLWKSYKLELGTTAFHGILAGISLFLWGYAFSKLRTAMRTNDANSEVTKQHFWRTAVMTPLTILSSTNFMRSALRLRSLVHDKKETELEEARKIYALIEELPCSNEA